MNEPDKVQHHMCADVFLFLKPAKVRTHVLPSNIISTVTAPEMTELCSPQPKRERQLVKGDIPPPRKSLIVVL